MPVATIKSITTKCPKTKKLAEVIFNPNSVFAESKPCVACGSHGDIKYTYTCTSCGKDHTTKMYDW